MRVTVLVSGNPEKARHDDAGFDRIRDDPAIGHVDIALPNSMHEGFVTRAARAGKHALCEKPMATSVAEAERMVGSVRPRRRS